MKTPRNQPCPCGSGTKFKRCCGSEEAKARTLAELLERQRVEAAARAETRRLERAAEIARERPLRRQPAGGLVLCAALLACGYFPNDTR